MTVSMMRRRIYIGLAIAAALVALVGGSLHYGAQILKTRIENALGPESQVGEIRLGWNAVELDRLRIKAPAGWPAPDALHADRIRIAPDFLRLLSGHIDVSAIVVEGGYLSALRGADGSLRVLPSLLEGKAEQGGSGPQLNIGAIEVRGGVFEFYDATVRRTPHRIRLEQVRAQVTDLRLPGLTARSQLNLEGVLKGVRSDGRIGIDGWMEFASRESVLNHSLQAVDLVALQPYLLKSSESGVRKGTLDLEMQSSIKANRLHAPGSLALNGLELEAGGTFMGLPRAAVVGLMKDKNERISFKFVLEGKLDDPDFRLNEGFSTRIAASLGDVLGVSIEGLAKGAGTVGQKGLDAAGGAAEGVGRAVKGIFGR